jgi:hypothetical protein
MFSPIMGETNSPEDTSLLTDVSERLGTERPHLGEWRERGW